MKRLALILTLAFSGFAADAYAHGGAQRVVVRQRAAPLVVRQRVAFPRQRVVVRQQFVAPQAFFAPQAIVVQQPALSFVAPQVQFQSFQSFSSGGCAEFFSY